MSLVPPLLLPLLTLCRRASPLALVFALGVHASLLAQASAPPAPPQSLSFFVFVGGENPPHELPFTVFVEGRPVDLRLPVGSLSEPLLRPAAPGLVLHHAQPPRQKKTPSGVPAPVPPELARVDIPQTWKNVLLLAAASRSGDKVQLRAYDVSETALPAATLGFYNLLGRDLAVRLNTVQALARPDALTPLPLVTRPDRQSGMFQLQVALQAEGAWQLAARQSFSLSKADRNFVLALPSGNGVELLYFHPPPDPVVKIDPAATPPPR